MQLIEEANRIYVEEPEGTLVAEVTFPEVAKGVCAINHTFVDESLRGQGTADKLLLATAKKLQREGLRARPVCSYAVHWFQKNSAYGFLLENE